MKKILVVDLVRAVSILLVMTGHLHVLFVNQHSSIYPLEYAWFKLWVNHGFGVSMFFVISGFLITRLMASEPNGLFNPDLRAFYSRRIGRILPLLTLICLEGLLILHFVKTSSPQLEHCFKNPASSYGMPMWTSIVTFGLNGYWYKLMGLPPVWGGHGLHWDVLWSLQMEEQFYLFYPLLLKKLRTERNLTLFLGFMILMGPLSIVLGWLKYPYANEVVANPLMSFHFIAMGCLLYLLSERWKGHLSARKDKALLVCSLGFLIFVTAYGHVYVRSNYWWVILGHPMIGIGTVLFLLGGSHVRIFQSQWLAPWTLPGKLSYGMYLLHSSVLFLLWPVFVGKNQFVAFAIYAAATIALAWLSYRYFEVPANLFLRKMLARPVENGTKP